MDVASSTESMDLLVGNPPLMVLTGMICIGDRNDPDFKLIEDAVKDLLPPKGWVLTYGLGLIRDSQEPEKVPEAEIAAMQQAMRR